jgi:hypothetical protein
VKGLEFKPQHCQKQANKQANKKRSALPICTVTWMNLKIILVKITTQKKAYILHDCFYMTLWEKRSYRDKKNGSLVASSWE